MAHSQYGQDDYLFQEFFSTKEKGFFVEVGADDGVRFSNSLYYEKLGWKGICIEPRPSIFEELKKNRNCKCLNYAIDTSESEVEFLDIVGYGRQLSGIVKNYDSKHLKRIQEESENPNFIKKELVNVSAKKLQTIFDEEQVEYVDFLSIDTEGSEVNVLKSIDYDKAQINVILIENNYNYNYPDLVPEFGKKYSLHASINHDEIYVRK